MKRLLSISFLSLMLLLGAHSSVANAEDLSDPGVVYQPATYVPATTDAAASDGGLAPSDKAAAAAAPAPFDPSKTDSGYSWVMIKIMQLFAWLVGVAALTLNYAVFYTVVKMGSYLNSLSAIGVTWRILRDIGNIMLIFGFLAAGIATILQSEWYGIKTKMIPALLISAVFLNFSLFFAEAIVDTGNLFATQFYQQIVGGKLPTEQSLSATTVASEGISNKIMSQLGLATIYGQARDPNTKIFEGANPWITGFMGIILFLITAFVMFSLAFILIARFVALVFLLVVAPLGFAGYAIPAFKARADEWWSGLFHQTMTAPVLLLMLYVALAVITDVNFLTGFGNGAKGPDWLGYVGVRNLQGFGGTMLSFLVAMGLLLLVLVYAKKWSAFGASFATKTAGKLTFGLTAMGLRSTVGMGSNIGARFIRGTRFGATKTGRVFATTLDKGATGSFDFRGTGALKNIPIIGDSVNAGDADKGGYRGGQKKNIEGHEAYAKSLTTRDQTEEEKKKIKDTEAAKKEAEKSAKDAEAAHKAALAAENKHKEELKRLEQEQEINAARGITDPAMAQRLTLAQSNLASSTAAVADAGSKLAAATQDFAEKEKVATDTKNKIDAVAGDALAKERRKAYAENIDGPLPVGSIPGWVIFGSGGRDAAKKIIKETKKNEKDKLLETLQKSVKDAENASHGDGAKEEKPPETH